MTFAPSGNGGEFLELVEGGLEYLGPRDLTQYFIRSAVVLMEALDTVIPITYNQVH